MIYQIKKYMTATKTWKIGEYATGGVITVNVSGNVIEIQNREWDYSKGTRKSSNQSNAKILSITTITNTEYSNAYSKAFVCLSDITTSYYASVIIEWIESKIGKLHTY